MRFHGETMAFGPDPVPDDAGVTVSITGDLDGDVAEVVLWLHDRACAVLCVEGGTLTAMEAGYVAMSLAEARQVIAHLTDAVDAAAALQSARGAETPP